MRASHGQNPLDILRRRLGLGEISAQEFEDIERVLGFPTLTASEVHGKEQGSSRAAKPHQ